MESERVDVNCVECGDQPAELFCQQCEDHHCKVCFQFLHKAGNRKKHTTTPLNLAARLPSPESKSQQQQDSLAMRTGELRMLETGGPDWFLSRSKSIPLRLTDEERDLLALLEGALDVSEYTERVDISSYNRQTLMWAQLNDLLCTLLGLKIAADYAGGLRAIKGRSLKDNATFFQRVFEVGRRHKIRNPDKMREGYGKMMYVLMDSVDMAGQLGFSLMAPLETVYQSLETHKALDLLSDPLMADATSEPIGVSLAKEQLTEVQRVKQEAITSLVTKYGRGDVALSAELKRCILSFCDHNNFLAHSSAPCNQMIQWLKSHFSKSSALAICYGRGGSRLTHSHSVQFAYVLESLTLWERIQREMYLLWCLAEADLLDPNSSYRLIDTGQGLQRCQRAPRIGRAMSEILQICTKALGGWVGSSVVHLGDRDVPNALIFIDKYIQVPRILKPIVSSIHTVELVTDPFVSKFIDRSFGSVAECTSAILADFFKHGFDGSGADNSYDAGPCIDGRLTSAWNWCSQLEKKPYFPIFSLAGFSGFDGQF